MKTTTKYNTTTLQYNKIQDRKWEEIHTSYASITNDPCENFVDLTIKGLDFLKEKWYEIKISYNRDTVYYDIIIKKNSYESLGKFKSQYDALKWIGLKVLEAL